MKACRTKNIFRWAELIPWRSYSWNLKFSIKHICRIFLKYISRKYFFQKFLANWDFPFNRWTPARLPPKNHCKQIATSKCSHIISSLCFGSLSGFPAWAKIAFSDFSSVFRPCRVREKLSLRDRLRICWPLDSSAGHSVLLWLCSRSHRVFPRVFRFSVAVFGGFPRVSIPCSKQISLGSESKQSQRYFSNFSVVYKRFEIFIVNILAYLPLTDCWGGIFTG